MAAEMIPVRSSNLAAVGHDPDTNELVVTFRSGSTYRYPGVDAETANALATDPSPGSYFARHIKGRTFRQE